jgi:type IV pilus assembly protein PilF
MTLFNRLKLFFLLVPMALMVVSCSSKKAELKARQANLHFGAGTQNLMEKQYTDALKNLLLANELTPDNPEILNNMGMAYYFKGERDLAIKTLNRVLKLESKNSDAKVNLATIYYHDANYSEAEKLYKQVLRDLTYDKQARTLYNLGILELQIKRDTVTAEKYFKKSIQEDESYCPSHFQLGIIRYNNRQFKSALRHFKDSAMGTCYETPAPHYYQAVTFMELGKFLEARLKFDEVDTRFSKSVFAVKARNKVLDLNEIEKKSKAQSHASRNVLESHDF